jgi:pyruvate dehydrogenase E2 component (dihydrolipoamide acetyltransferase)
MVVEFKLPDIGEGVAEGEIVQWFVEEGATVQEDAPLVAVLTDKANVEIPSPRSGKVLKLHARVGEKVKVGAVLVTFEGGGPTPAAGAATAAAPAAPAPTATQAVTAGTAAAAPERILATPYVRRLAAERGVDLGQVRGSGPGGRIVEADLEGAKTQAAAGAVKAIPAPASSAPAPAPAATPVPTPEVPPAPAKAGEERIPIRGIRRVIAEHMSEATHRAAHYTYVEEIDASELVRWRDRMAPHVEKNGVRLSYLPFIMKAVSVGLRAHPWMNAHMDDERGELVVQSHHHMGIATATKDGLIVPVVRDVDRKSVSHLAREIHDLANRGREGKLKREEMTGSTFTITSLGALGGVLATPILNYPEVAILGVHKIQQRPVYRADGTIGPAQLMNLSVSLDHRVLDGAVAAQFLAVVKSHLEDPHQLFAETA